MKCLKILCKYFNKKYIATFLYTSLTDEDILNNVKTIS